MILIPLFEAVVYPLAKKCRLLTRFVSPFHRRFFFDLQFKFFYYERFEQTHQKAILLLFALKQRQGFLQFFKNKLREK